MSVKEICPCPNLKCPNHGNCEKCISRHVRKGFLNYCAFHTLLPTLRKVIDASPDSETAKEMDGLIQLQLQAYEKLMEENGLSPHHQEILLKKIAEYSDY